jgi:hypothetical protein
MVNRQAFMSRLDSHQASADDRPAPEPIGKWSRWIRLAVTAIVLGLVLAGTVLGSDDDFPLGPFHMYSSRTDPNSVSRQLRVRVVLASGAVLDVTNASGAPRRAELEGREAELQSNPAELAKLAPLYTAHLAGSPRRLELVWQNDPLHHGRTAASYDTIICSVPVS